MGSNGTETFAQSLAALKRRGCSLLVVGAAPDTAVDVCGRLLGNAVAGPRRRVVVLAGATPGAGERLSKPASDPVPDRELLRVVDRRGPTRSGSATGAETGTAAPPVGLESLEADVERAIAELEPEQGLDPAELRVCLDSVGPFLDANGADRTRALLATLGDRTRAHDGMFHAHLPLPHGTPRVETLSDPFDAVVELRPSEQRWHVTDEGLTTDWLSL